MFSQLVAWGSTFFVIRILSPEDYGLYAMTGVVLALLALMNGYGLANAYIQQRTTSPKMLRQLFGMLIMLNGALAAIQFATAPWVAQFYREPQVVAILRVQTLLYLTNPFLALGYAVLSRAMDFRRQAQINVISALIGAIASLSCALAGLGVWTLVIAPLALFSSRALGMAFAANALVRPSFDFRGAWQLASYGGAVTLSSLFWFVQTQADVVIAGRAFSAHELGIYTTALFLAQIFVGKVVPPLNEVAFSAYARVQDDKTAFAAGFLKSVRIICLVGLPLAFGLAAAAPALIPIVLGDKWSATVPVIRLLALAMPFVTIQVLFGPAANAAGRPGLITRTTILGATFMTFAFLVGVRWGAAGMAAAWLVAYPALTVISAFWVLPAIGVRPRQLVDAIAQPALAAIAMACAVIILDASAAGFVPIARLTWLIILGGVIYVGWMMLFARHRLAELLALFRQG